MMPRRWQVVAGIVITAATVVACQPTSAPSGPAVVVVRGTGHPFDGWGTSLAWWAEEIGLGNTPAERSSGPQWDANRQNKLMDLFFAPPGADIGTPGLGLTILRYNIGASPASTDTNRPPGTCAGMGIGRAVPTVIAPNGTADLSRDHNQVAILRGALQRIGPDATVEGFANSPPWWLTINHCPSGQDNGSDNLADSNDIAYATYLQQTVRAFADSGIVFHSLDPFNESDAQWWNNGQCGSHDNCQEGAHITPGQQGRILHQLCPTSGHPGTGPLADGRTIVSSSDANTVDAELNDYFGYDPVAQACVRQFNTHGYSGTDAYTGGSRPELASLATDSGKPVWMSEFGTNNAKDPVSLAMQIEHDLADLHPTAWIYWQPVEDNWGLVNTRIDHPSTLDDTATWGAHDLNALTNRFAQLELFSRFIRPHATILDVTDPEHDPQHPTNDQRATIAARSADGNTLVVTVTNRTARRPYQVDLTAVTTNGTWTVTGAYRTTGGAPVAISPPQLNQGKFVATPPSGSVTTYVLHRGATPEVAACPPDGDILAAARKADPGIGDFATVSDRRCDNSDVAAWIDNSANGIAVLAHRTAGRLTVVAVGPNVCDNPAVKTASVAVKQFFNC